MTGLLQDVPLRAAHVVEASRLHRGCGDYSRFGYRGQYNRLQFDQCHAAAAVSIPASGSHSHGLGNRAQAERKLAESGSREFSRLEGAELAIQPAGGSSRLGRESDWRQRGRACRRFTGKCRLLFIAGHVSATGPQHRERGFPGRGCACGGHQQRILAAASGRRSWDRRQAIAPERSEVHRDWHCVSGF